MNQISCHCPNENCIVDQACYCGVNDDCKRSLRTDVYLSSPTVPLTLFASLIRKHFATLSKLIQLLHNTAWSYTRPQQNGQI
jgi:hypothetical protein